VLLSFIALVGMRGPGTRMKAVADSLKTPMRAPAVIGRFLAETVRARFSIPPVPVHNSDLMRTARRLGKLIRRLRTTVDNMLIRHREEVVERQLVQERIAWLAMELFASACALSRWDNELTQNNRVNDTAARYFLADSLRRAELCLQGMHSNDDFLVRDAAK
jgi:hypothetical protein